MTNSRRATARRWKASPENVALPFADFVAKIGLLPLNGYDVLAFPDFAFEYIVTEGKFWQTEVVVLDAPDNADHDVEEKKSRY